MTNAHPLDNPVLAGLLGPHASLAERHGAALRYQPEVSPFLALPDLPGQRGWADLAVLLGPGGIGSTGGVIVQPPPEWEVLRTIDGLQLTGEQVSAAPDLEASPLGPADVPEMMALVARARPGPFRPRTVELGGYLGIRHAGQLIAMAGQRMRTPGWTEVSAVCTDQDFRGRGLGTGLTLAVAAAIRDRGDVPFLHVAVENTAAIRLYDSLGFRPRREAAFIVLRASGG
jgi:ribosomal protein S18 acetylase RimI-like enzyme